MNTFRKFLFFSMIFPFVPLPSTPEEHFPSVFGEHYWQSKEWEHAKKARGGEAFWMSYGNAKTLVIVRKAHPLKFWVRPFWEIPRGPIGSVEDIPKLLNDILQHAKQQNIPFVRVYPPFGTDCFWEKILGDLSCSHFRTAPEIFPTNTLMLDISKSEDEILKQMKQKGRYNIRLAEKKGVSVEPVQNVDAFWKLMKQTTLRDGFRSVKRHVFVDILERFGENGVLLVAKDSDGDVLAGGIFTVAGDMAVYNYGASSNRKRNMMAPYVLQWKGIEWAKSRGAKIYDFLGISPENTPDHQLENVAGFKLKFGGIRIVCDEGKDLFV